MPRPSQPARRMMLQPHPIRLALVVSAELQEDAVGQEPGGDLRRAGAAAVAQDRTEQAEPQFASVALVSWSAA